MLNILELTAIGAVCDGVRATKAVANSRKDGLIVSHRLTIAVSE